MKPFRPPPQSNDPLRIAHNAVVAALHRQDSSGILTWKATKVGEVLFLLTNGTMLKCTMQLVAAPTDKE